MEKSAGLIRRVFRRLRFTRSPSVYTVRSLSESLRKEILKFDSRCGVNRAKTPPGSWYVNSELHKLEAETVFANNWIAVPGYAYIKKTGDYVTGFLDDEPYLITRDDDDNNRYFYNLCRHHGTLLCDHAKGCAREFECPYHGWKYSLGGKLAQARRLRGIENFSAKNYGLLHFNGTSLLNSFWLNKNANTDTSQLRDQLAPVEELLENCDADMSNFTHIHNQIFSLNCNWKVVIDNYLDGAYHVPVCHKDLNSLLENKKYDIDVHKHYSVLSASGEDGSRVEGEINFIHAYPNLFINKYGRWIDINYIIPTGIETCNVVFDWYYDSRHLEQIGGSHSIILQQGIRDSIKVQEEDIEICERVQIAMRSKAYQFGRYAPRLEQAMYDFHCKLQSDYLSTNHNSEQRHPPNETTADCYLTGANTDTASYSTSASHMTSERIVQYKLEHDESERCNLTGVIIPRQMEPEVREHNSVCGLTGVPIKI